MLTLGRPGFTAPEDRRACRPRKSTRSWKVKVIWSPEARQGLRDLSLHLGTENPYTARPLQARIKQGVQLLRDNPRIERTG